jgi:hypothetical protein
MKMRNWIILIGLLFIGLGVFFLRPVPIPDEKDCLSLKGTLIEVYEGEGMDIVFKLRGIDKVFYINRGRERGLDINKLKADLTNKEIVIKYPKYWTPLNPRNSVRHISKIECGGKTIFSDLE